MSDPFDAFESALNLNEDNQVQRNEDPAAEFLAREQAEFSKIENNDFLSDNFGDFASSKTEQAATTNDFDDNDPFGIGSSGEKNSPTNETKENNNDKLVSNSSPNSPDSDRDWVLVDNKETLNIKESERMADLYSAISSADKLTNEPEQMKTWREEQKTRLQTKDAEEEIKKKEWKESAKKELDDWYRKRKEQLEKQHDNNKAAEADLVAPRDSQQNQDWDRVSKLCDFNPKGNKNTRDIGRMRSILLQLKQQPLVR